MMILLPVIAEKIGEHCDDEVYDMMHLTLLMACLTDSSCKVLICRLSLEAESCMCPDSCELELIKCNEQDPVLCNLTNTGIEAWCFQRN